MSGYRKAMTGEFEAFRGVEIAKAIQGLGKGKAPGPDGVTAELLRGLPALEKGICSLLTCIVRSGNFPQPLLQLYVTPLDKPGKDAEACASKRPISLISVLAKLLETAILNRILPRIEPQLDGRQYAYRRARGTELHLLEIFDFISEAGERGDYVYVASMDVDSAFDKVAHASIIRTAERAGSDCYTCRYIRIWLTRRRFRVRLRSPMGDYLSTHRKITRGLPQGGVLSPALWLMHINGLFEYGGPSAELAGGLWAGLRRCLLVYADDVLFALAHPKVPVLREAADSETESLTRGLHSLDLNSAEEKSLGMVIAPKYTVGQSFFRRGPDALRASAKQARSTDDDLEHLRELSWREDAPTPQWRLDPLYEGWPFPVVAKMRVLGVVLDCRMCFEGQVASILDRAKIRMGVVAKLSGCEWGAETGVLRMTGEALAVSLIRYGLVVMGSGAYEQSLNALEVGVVNVLVRRVCGVGRSARLPVLHSTAGLLSVHNLYIQRCAETVMAAMKAEASSIQARVVRHVEEAYGMPSWDSDRVAYRPSRPLPGRVVEHRFWDVDMTEYWWASLHERPPALKQMYKTPSVFFTSAKEAEQQPNLKATTFNFHGASNWWSVGLQVLHATGWRPDCTISDRVNLDKVLPPRDPNGWIIIGTREQMRWQQGECLDREESLWHSSPGSHSISVGSFFQDKVGGVLCLAAKAEWRSDLGRMDIGERPLLGGAAGGHFGAKSPVGVTASGAVRKGGKRPPSAVLS